MLLLPVNSQMQLQPQQLHDIGNTVGTPVHILFEDVIDQNIHRILDAAKKHGFEKNIRLLLAYFCNPNPLVFERLLERNHNIRDRLGILLQNYNERMHFETRKSSLPAETFTFSPGVLSDAQIDALVATGSHINFTSPPEVEYALKKQLKEFGIRFDLKGGKRTGTHLADVKAMKELVQDVPRLSTHVYTGTRSHLPEMIQSLRQTIAFVMDNFPQTKLMNMGGGFTHYYNMEDDDLSNFDWDAYLRELRVLVDKHKIPKDVLFCLEPGRSVFAKAGQYVMGVNRKPYRGNMTVDGSRWNLPSVMHKELDVPFHIFNPEGIEVFPDYDDPEVQLSGVSAVSSDIICIGTFRVPKDIGPGWKVSIGETGAYGSAFRSEALSVGAATEVVIDAQGRVIEVSRRSPVDDRIRLVPHEARMISQPKQKSMPFNQPLRTKDLYGISDSHWALESYTREQQRDPRQDHLVKIPLGKKILALHKRILSRLEGIDHNTFVSPDGFKKESDAEQIDAFRSSASKFVP